MVRDKSSERESQEQAKDAPERRDTAPEPRPVSAPKEPVEEVEMGGEAPCQLPQFWDAEE